MMGRRRTTPSRQQRARDVRLRARDVRLRAERDLAWDRGRDARLAGRPPANPYTPGSERAEAYDAAYRLTQPPGTRPEPPARRRPGAARQSLAQVAGALCRLRDFQLWICAADADEAAVILRARCGIQSRRELDTNPAAARRFHERVRGPFAKTRES